jgi:hypothetical protein
LVDLGLLQRCPVPGRESAFDSLSLLCGKNIWTLWEADLEGEGADVREVWELTRAEIRSKFGTL